MECELEMESMQRVFEVFANKPDDRLLQVIVSTDALHTRENGMTLEEAFIEARKGTRP